MVVRDQVHGGFAAAYLKVKDGVMVKLADLHAANPLPVVICGHSLGGALAALLALDLALSSQRGA